MILKSLHMVDWRSVEDAQIDLGQGIPTLLYGENEAGKSNVLAAIDTFCRLLAFAVNRGLAYPGSTFGWCTPSPGQTDPDTAVRLEHPVRHGSTRAILIGNVVHEQGSLSAVRFDIKADPLPSKKEDIRLNEVELVSIEGDVPSGAPRVLHLGETRSFHEEFLPDLRSGPASLTVAPDGSGVKSALFRLANHPQNDLRARYHDEFRDLVRGSPFGLPDPVMAFGDAREIQLLFDGQPIEEHGAGCRQWVLLAGMIAAVSPHIVLLEEPETNLSWKMQQQIVGLLQRLAEKRQIVVATHSPNLGHTVGEEERWYEVTRTPDSGPTVLDLRHGIDELWQSFRLSLKYVEDPADPRKLTLFPGNVVRLHEPAVRHLGVSIGDTVVTSLEPDQTLRMISLKRWIGDDDGPH